MGLGFDQAGKPKGPKVSLYIVSPSSDMDRIKPLTRLVLNMTLRRLTEGMAYNADGTSKSLYPHRLLLLIDEFPSLGKLDVFEEALAFIAGYGLKALLITQDLSQLQKAYSKDESIVSNCHIRIAYAPNKIETAELLSHMTGKTTVTQTQLQYSGSRLAMMLQNVNTSENTVGRELLTPDECMRLPEGDELVFMAGHSPIYCQKIKYYADRQLNARMLMRAASSQGRKAEGASA
jgi:type IV secretion system protein VirD4